MSVAKRRKKDGNLFLCIGRGFVDEIFNLCRD